MRSPKTPASPRRALGRRLANVALLLAVTAVCLLVPEGAVRWLDLLAAPRRAAEPKEGAEPKGDADRVLSPLVPHPFLGWVHRPGERREAQRSLFPEGRGPAWYRRNNRTNLFGQYSEIDDYRQLDDADFVVGIFGGSVAGDLALVAGDVLVRRLETQRPELSGSVRLVSFAMGGYKQPQQLMALAEAILAGVPLDVVVNLDGVNEIGFGERFARRGVHPLFPHREILTAALELTRGTPSWQEVELMAAVVDERRAAERWRRRATGPLLAKSELVRAVAGSFVLAAERRAASSEAELRDLLFASAQTVANLPEPCLDEPFACLDLIAEIWESSSRSMAALAAERGAVYLHLLQPNQYVRGSKPLSAEEEAEFYDPRGPWAESIRRGYPLLKRRGRALRSAGVEYHDLTKLFHSRQETLYRDTCCHLNVEGNRMLARSIATRIVRALEAQRGSGSTLRSARPPS